MMVRVRTNWLEIDDHTIAVAVTAGTVNPTGDGCAPEYTQAHHSWVTLYETQRKAEQSN